MASGALTLRRTSSRQRRWDGHQTVKRCEGRELMMPLRWQSQKSLVIVVHNDRQSLLVDRRRSLVYTPELHGFTRRIVRR